MKKVMVAMSGGIDSSVTAALLLEQGYEVAGITMKLISDCSIKDPATEAALVATQLGIEHHVIDVIDFFDSTVINNFVSEYSHGLTPNPCVRCNHVLKFGLLLDKSIELGCDFFATGHYAVIDNCKLIRGTDRHKDQSYFLYSIYSRPIERILFPLGTMTKPDVRLHAERIGLHNAKKGESQDICFIPDGDCAGFLRNRIGDAPLSGPITDIRGKVIGKHSGIYAFTIGQRKGLGALGKPMFVKEIHPENNTVVAAEDHELMCSGITIKNVIFSADKVDETKKYSIQVRYRSAPVFCTIDSLTENTMVVTFCEPVRAIAPGQAAVIYDGDVVVCGGTIII
jgi:tRNA-specific 2-thiouridylase